MDSTLSSVERQEQIARLIGKRGRANILEICTEFTISEATARRDLDALSERGLIQRVHGGAILVRRAVPEEPMLRRTHEQETDKKAIGLAGASLVKDGDTVFLGSGSTVLEVARNLTERNITVITNSLPVINLMSERPNISLVALGGMLRATELSFIGHITEQAVVELRADKVFIGTHALSLDEGMTNDYLPETLTDRAILNVGRQVIVVADHSKFGLVSTAFLAPLKIIHTLVTDGGTDPEFVETLKSHGVDVIIA